MIRRCPMKISIAKDVVLQEINQESVDYEHSIDKLYRKQTGSYYTSIDLTLSMMQELVDNLDPVVRNTLYSKKFLEPCVGTGNFVFAYLKVCENLNFTKSEYKELVNNIYVFDINEDALSIYKKNLSKLVQTLFDIDLDENYFSTHIGSSLLFDVQSDETKYIPIENAINNHSFPKYFDIVVTNPPYKNLKAEKSHYFSEEQYLKDKEKYSQITKLANLNFYYSTSGVLNIYKLFVEEIVETYLSPKGICSLLIPSSILSDKSCSNLRTRILDTCSIKSIRLISENNDYIDASQALCSILFYKGNKTKKICIDGSFDGNIKQGTIMDISDIMDESTGNSILILSQNEYQIRRKMKENPTVKELDYIYNLRGELDVTNNKNSIVNSHTPYQLIRGKHIGYYKTLESSEKEFVLEQFVQNTTKQKYIRETRLVCQQVANIAKKRRVSFSIVPPNCVLANSCNFISVKPNKDDVDIFFLLGVLNSTLIDWYFKLTSSNNHINNYEIDNFPIPIFCKNKKEISDLVKKYLQNNNDDALQKLDSLVYQAYGISSESDNSTPFIHDNKTPYDIPNRKKTAEKFYEDLKCIISDISKEEAFAILNKEASIEDICFLKKNNITFFEKKVLENLEEKYCKMHSNIILNHTTFKLSDLDLEMIANIPQGGNWKDIPSETVKKSKRLERITETGGRTTLYGRIDYQKPSYTITTYFNRPGNGTYVHPIHQRVISVREAARFQTFPDDYYFTGNKTDTLNQVGNAVPVLLAYQIGKKIIEKTGCSSSVDLFSGAGGMTYGFKRAGIKASIANDFDRSACITLKTNSPEIPVICGDIASPEIKNQIISAGISSHANIICGGPPCQGFSLAGFRKKDDPRNELFRHFIDIVSAIHPKVIVFENVEGIMSYQKGKTYANIIELFSELGYYIEGRKLLSSEYGVPQKRKRVILLGTRKVTNIMPNELFPEQITAEPKNQISAYHTIYDLEHVDCSEYAQYNSNFDSPILRYFKNQISIDEYISTVKEADNNYNQLSLF